MPPKQLSPLALSFKNLTQGIKGSLASLQQPPLPSTSESPSSTSVGSDESSEAKLGYILLYSSLIADLLAIDSTFLSSNDEILSILSLLQSSLPQPSSDSPPSTITFDEDKAYSTLINIYKALSRIPTKPNTSSRNNNDEGEAYSKLAIPLPLQSAIMFTLSQACLLSFQTLTNTSLFDLFVKLQDEIDTPTTINTSTFTVKIMTNKSLEGLKKTLLATSEDACVISSSLQPSLVGLESLYDVKVLAHECGLSSNGEDGASAAKSFGLSSFSSASTTVNNATSYKYLGPKNASKLLMSMLDTLKKTSAANQGKLRGCSLKLAYAFMADDDVSNCEVYLKIYEGYEGVYDREDIGEYKALKLHLARVTEETTEETSTSTSTRKAQLTNKSGHIPDLLVDQLIADVQEYLTSPNVTSNVRFSWMKRYASLMEWYIDRLEFIIDCCTSYKDSLVITPIVMRNVYDVCVVFLDVIAAPVDVDVDSGNPNSGSGSEELKSMIKRLLEITTTITYVSNDDYDCDYTALSKHTRELADKVLKPTHSITLTNALKKNMHANEFEFESEFTSHTRSSKIKVKVDIKSCSANDTHGLFFTMFLHAIVLNDLSTKNSKQGYKAALSGVRKTFESLEVKYNRSTSSFEESVVGLGDLAIACFIISSKDRSDGGGGGGDVSERYDDIVKTLEENCDEDNDNQVLLCIALIAQAKCLKKGCNFESALEKCESSTNSINKLDQQIGKRGNYFTITTNLQNILTINLALTKSQIQYSLKSIDTSRKILESIVTSNPTSYVSLLELGKLYMKLGGAFLTERVYANTTLLKAAKLSDGAAEPFALLGLWYEHAKDNKRAIGCYAKALSIHPSNPIAGRGLLRVSSFKDNEAVVVKAASFVEGGVNGWAWIAVGDGSVRLGKDEKGVACYHEALRCSDVLASDSFYYALPVDGEEDSSNSNGSGNDMNVTTAWTKLASAYRRLGKYSASHLSYLSAEETLASSPSTKLTENTPQLPLQTMCNVASVEIELGLIASAVQRYEYVLKNDEFNKVAAFGLSLSYFMLARESLLLNKIGQALTFLQLSVANEGMLFESSDVCVIKHLGDTFTSFLNLPSSLFSPSNGAQLEYAIEGEKCYFKALGLLQQNQVNGEMSDDAKFEAAVIACDLGISFFKRKAVDNSIKALKTSIDFNSEHAPSWNALGCAYRLQSQQIGESEMEKEKCILLAQHCYSRCIQIDKAFYEAWSNLGILYTSSSQGEGEENKAIREIGMECFDALTQILDTPLMWIGRGLASSCSSSSSTGGVVGNTKGIDCFKAALQSEYHVDAVQGYATTNRLDALHKMKAFKEGSKGADGVAEDIHVSCRNGESFTKIHSSLSFNHDIGANIRDLACNDDYISHSHVYALNITFLNVRQLCTEGKLDEALMLCKSGNDKGAEMCRGGVFSCDYKAVAEGLCLGVWIERCIAEGEEGVEGGGEEDEVDEKRKKKMINEIQRALIIDPLNVFAREALDLFME